MSKQKTPNSPALTDKDKAEIVKWLTEKTGGKHPCNVCQADDWVLGDHLIAPPLSTMTGGVILGGPSYPSAILVCKNCGHTQFFNAIVMGLIKEPTKEGAPEGGGNG